MVGNSTYKLYVMLAAVVSALFVGGLLTDMIYSRSAEMMWADFSAWLISAGVVLGYLTALIGLVALIANRRVGIRKPVWIHAAATIVVLAVATINMLIHTHDAWTSVVPWGIALSAATVVVLVISGWAAWPSVYGPDVEEIAS